VGSAVGTRADILEALDFVDQGLVQPKVKHIAMADLSKVVAAFSQVCFPAHLQLPLERDLQPLSAPSLTPLLLLSQRKNWSSLCSRRHFGEVPSIIRAGLLWIVARSLLYLARL
jgi:hypothetical protein